MSNCPLFAFALLRVLSKIMEVNTLVFCLLLLLFYIQVIYKANEFTDIALPCILWQWPLKSFAQFDSEEDERLLQASEKFEREAAKAYPDRPCITTVIDLSGKMVFITRYVRPLNPPKKFLDGLPSNSQDVSHLSEYYYCSSSEWMLCSDVMTLFYTGHGCPVCIPHPNSTRQGFVFWFLWPVEHLWCKRHLSDMLWLLKWR